MTGSHWYCRPCDAWYRRAEGHRCPACDGELESRTMSYPEDVFGPPEMGEAPTPRRSDAHRYPREKSGNTGLGILYVIIGHVLLAMLSSTQALEGAWIVIGVAQMLYVVPMMIFFAVAGKGATVTGVALAAGITFLLNAACFGIVCGGL